MVYFYLLYRRVQKSDLLVPAFRKRCEFDLVKRLRIYTCLSDAAALYIYSDLYKDLILHDSLAHANFIRIFLLKKLVI